MTNMPNKETQLIRMKTFDNYLPRHSTSKFTQKNDELETLLRYSLVILQTGTSLMSLLLFFCPFFAHFSFWSFEPKI